MRWWATITQQCHVMVCRLGGCFYCHFTSWLKDKDFVPYPKAIFYWYFCWEIKAELITWGWNEKKELGSIWQDSLDQCPMFIVTKILELMNESIINWYRVALIFLIGTVILIFLIGTVIGKIRESEKWENQDYQTSDRKNLNLHHSGYKCID